MSFYIQKNKEKQTIMQSKIIFTYKPNGNEVTVKDNGNKVYQGSVATTEFYLYMADAAEKDNWLPTDSVFVNITRPDGQQSGPLLMMHDDNGWKYTSNGWLENSAVDDAGSNFTVSFTMRRHSTLSSSTNITYVATRTTEMVSLQMYPSASWTPLDILPDGTIEAVTAELGEMSDKINTHTQQIKAIQTEQTTQNNAIKALQTQSTNLQQSVASNTSDIAAIKTEQSTQNTDISALKEKDIVLQNSIDLNATNIAQQGKQIANNQSAITALQNSVLTGETYVGILPSATTMPTATQIQQYYNTNVGRQPKLGDVLFFTLTSASGYKVYKYFYTVTGWQNYEIPGANVGSNPNLLINSNFAINQRGQTEYSGTNFYSVDRWFGNNVTVRVGDNKVYIQYLGSTYGQFSQFIETDLTGKTAILSATIDGVRYVCPPIVCSTNMGSVVGNLKIETFGDMRIIYSTTKNAYGVFFAPTAAQGGNTEHSIEDVKLEIGKVATAFTPPNIAEELLKCQRYYQRWICGGNGYTLLGIGYSYNTTNTIYLPYKLTTTMRKAPTVAYDGAFRVLGLNTAITNIAKDQESPTNVGLRLSVANNPLSTNSYYTIGANNDIDVYVAFDAEL